MLNSSIFINTIVIVAALSILGIIALFIYSLMKKEEEQPETESERPSESYEKILKDADTKAASLLDKTESTAEHILSETKTTNEHIAESLDRILQQIAQKHIADMNQAAVQFQKIHEASLNELKAKFDELSKQTVQETQTRVSATLEMFTKELMGKSINGQDMIDKKAQVLLAKAEQEIAEYKRAQIEKIESQTRELLEKTYHQVLRVTMPEAAQRDLIIEALEKAKEEGVLEL